MYASKIIIALAASSMASAGIVHLAERVAMPLGALEARAAVNGWSLQSSSAPSGLSSCGQNAYCPSGTTCNAKASAEVAACCTSGDCRGEVEGAPKCADSAWSLWKGYNGNGFCCEVGQVGVYDSSSNTAGTCVSSAGSGVTEAVLMSTGTGSGSAASTTAAASSSAASSTVAASSTAVVATTHTSTSAVSTSTGSSTTSTVSGTSTASSVSSVSTSIVAVVTSSASSSSNGTATVGTSTSTSTGSATGAASTGAAGKLSAGFAGLAGAVLMGLAL